MFWALPISPRAGASPRSAPQRSAPRRIAHPSPARAINRAPQPGTALRGQDREPSRGCAPPRHATHRTASRPDASRPDAPHRSPIVRPSRSKGHHNPAQAFVLKAGKPSQRHAFQRYAAPLDASHRPAPRRDATPRSALPSLSVNDQDRPHPGQPFAVKTGKPSHCASSYRTASRSVPMHRHALPSLVGSTIKNPPQPGTALRGEDRENPATLRFALRRSASLRSASLRIAPQRSAHPSLVGSTIKNPPHPGQAFVPKPGKPSLRTAPPPLAAPRIALRRHASLTPRCRSTIKTVLNSTSPSRRRSGTGAPHRDAAQRLATRRRASHRSAPQRFAHPSLPIHESKIGPNTSSPTW